MVAGDLVALDEVMPAFVEPACEALVELGAHGLGQRVVGRVSDKEVPEPERVLAGEGGTIGANELLTDEPHKARAHLRLAR